MMSLILDALRKSERSRRQSLGGQIGAGDPPSGRARLPVPWVTLLGVLLLVNALALGVFYWRSPQTSAGMAGQDQAYRPSVRSLADEAAAPAPPSTPALTPAQPAAPPPPVVPAAAPAAPSPSELPTGTPAGLPPLHLDVHAYAAKPAERFVTINLVQYHIGDTLKEGPQVVDITPQGVILEYQGSRFLLPRT